MMSHNRRAAFCIGTALAFMTGAYGWGDTLHALFLADTDDPTIGNFVAISSNGISDQLNELCDFAGMQKDFVRIRGQDLTRQRVDACLEKLAVSGDDAVFFHYDGHGCAWTSEWPALAFDNSALDLNEVVQKLRRKKPRLLVVLADCCNVVCGVPEQGAQARARMPAETIRKGARKLLLDHAGLFVGCGACRGEEARCNGVTGSLFTHVVAEKLYWEARSVHPSWYGLCVEQVPVSEQVIQHPRYEVDVRRLGRIPETEVLGGLDLQGYVERKYGGGKAVLQDPNAYGWRALVPVCEKLGETLELRTNATYDLDMSEAARWQYGEDAFVSYRSFEDGFSWFVFRDR
jgi:hypothetical protein